MPHGATSFSLSLKSETLGGFPTNLTVRRQLLSSPNRNLQFGRTSATRLLPPARVVCHRFQNWTLFVSLAVTLKITVVFFYLCLIKCFSSAGKSFERERNIKRGFFVSERMWKKGFYFFFQIVQTENKDLFTLFKTLSWQSKTNAQWISISDIMNSTLSQMQVAKINLNNVAQYAFKILMIHLDLRFTLLITFHCVLHRLRNQDIHQIR